VAPKGRRAAAALRQDTTPGRVLALALVANLPVFLAFILLPLLASGDRRAGLWLLPYVVYGTPLVAIGSLGVYLRAPQERKRHNASRLGLMLALAALLLWLLVVLSPGLRGGA